jgi:hypothetical protein
MNNLFISYQLNESEKNLEQVDKAIESLGNSTKLHNNCWYVNSPENAADAIKRVSRFLTEEDTLVVSDASNNETTWFNLEDKRAQRVRQNWKM